jgi:shikimate dehydrogenase
MDDAGGGWRVSGATRVVGIIGWPVSESISPAIHNAAFAALGLDWTYVPLPVPPNELPAAVSGLEALGFAGANVTMPHKTQAAALLGSLSEDAERLSAVNTIVVGPAGPVGHNTDAPGFDRFLRRDAGFETEGRTALILGAGGVARACALALALGGAKAVTVAARDATKVASLRSALDGLNTKVDVVAFDDAATAHVDLVVNATPLGGAGEVLPVPSLHPGMLVVDLLYRPATTPLLEVAQAARCPALGGLGLLLHQAALSFELWTGQPAPLADMSAAGSAVLSEHR